jgi:hypothetical protein
VRRPTIGQRLTNIQHCLKVVVVSASASTDLGSLTNSLNIISKTPLAMLNALLGPTGCTPYGGLGCVLNTVTVARLEQKGGLFCDTSKNISCLLPGD